MDKPAHEEKEQPVEPRHLDRLLADGGLSGPQRDAMWASMEAKVAPPPSFLRRGVRWIGLHPWWSAALVPVAAVLVVVNLRSPMDNAAFTVRGASPVGPRIESTCGDQEHPCQVGTPIYVRVAAPQPHGVLYVALKQSPGAQLLTGPLPVKNKDLMAIPVKLIPESMDVASGISIMALWQPTPVDDGALASLLAPEKSTEWSVLDMQVTP